VALLKALTEHSVKHPRLEVLLLEMPITTAVGNIKHQVQQRFSFKTAVALSGKQQLQAQQVTQSPSSKQ